jgi:hypothetical protein
MAMELTDASTASTPVANPRPHLELLLQFHECAVLELCRPVEVIVPLSLGDLQVDSLNLLLQVLWVGAGGSSGGQAGR